MLGQTEIAKLLKQCNGDALAMEEVLCAYVVWKYVKGRSNEHVLEKLRQLRMYLSVTGQRDILRAGQRAFRIVMTECALGEQSRLGVLPATTPIGKRAWNDLRRSMSGTQIQVITDSRYGGPAPVQAFLNAEQRRQPRVAEDLVRPGWLERYFLSRPQLGNENLPPGYPEGNDRSDGGTLPMYLSRISEQLASISHSLESHHSLSISVPLL
ncbi:hypothetical protein FIBSPDRAFT_1050993 [Athelia psychrophila]|uniref:Uncharacterized protein n=1 Tax=Athelia psychrophila TaxID=1759441 RepID=A0A165ZY91_9AGAM|nr:hypothetical protein FIBSPDRAFT_1050993 [Fibularhizoctonia sp. CBS 109695]